MIRQKRVLAYITRDTDRGRELLVFEIPAVPDARVQVPARRVDPGEELEPALVREIEEESGPKHVRIVRELPGFEEHYASRYDNHGYHVVPTEEVPTRGITSSTEAGTTPATSFATAGSRSSRNFTCSSDSIPLSIYSWSR